MSAGAQNGGTQRRSFLADYRSLSITDRLLLQVFAVAAVTAYMVLGTRYAWLGWVFILLMVVSRGVFGRTDDVE